MREERGWTVLELLRWTEEHFRAAGIDTPRLDAEILLAHALGTKRLGLYLEFEKPTHPDERRRFRELVVRRARERVPVALLLGVREFWSLELKISSDVLSPRPETETLVEVALAKLRNEERAYRVLDLGTGSGAVALAIKHERPRALVTATDISASALQIARTNAEQLHLSDGLYFAEGDLFLAVPGERFDLVVSNPPYIARRDAGELPPELAHEPEVALFGGEDGYAVLERVVAGVGEALLPGGAVALEVGPDQAGRVADWLGEAGFGEIEIVRDLARRPRVVAASKTGGPGVPESESEQVQEPEQARQGQGKVQARAQREREPDE